jgi:vacuolar-type H+-ATPase catalytic subunit A/Vma1
MATDNTTVYNALGDLPTNYQAFEDDTTSATDADKERADSLKALYENEDAIVNMCSVVGAVIWQSWKKRNAATKQNNLFNAIAAIIAEDSKNSGTTNSTSSWEAKLENFFNFSWIDKWFGKNKKEQAEQLSEFQQQALTSLQSIDKVVELLTFAQVKDSNIDLIAIATDSFHVQYTCLSVFAVTS